jgi:transposase
MEESAMSKMYIVRLTIEERQQLEATVRRGRGQAYKIKHANILLATDADGPNWPDEKAAQAFRCHLGTVANVRQRFVEQGIGAAIARKKRDNPPTPRLLDGRAEARLIALACGSPPLGRTRWTLKLLAKGLVELEVVPSISDQTVRRTLKKMNLSHICAANG